MADEIAQRACQRDCTSPMSDAERELMPASGKFLLEGERVEYDLVDGPDGPVAINIRLL